MVDQPTVTDERARQILERAAQIDRDASGVVPIETLRAAAREAGIGEAAFAAALEEHAQAASRDAARDRAAQARRRLVVGAMAGVGGLVTLLLGSVLLLRLFP